MFRNIKRCLPIVLVTCATSLFLLTGCKSDGDEGPTTQAAVNMGAINDMCPIMGGDVNPSADSVSYEGAKVGFCCNGCVGKWNSWSDSKKRQYVAKQ